MDIIAQIIQSANGHQASKRRLLYDTLMSYMQLTEYLSFLMEIGLLEYQNDTNTYTATEKGIRFLEMYEMMEEITTAETKTA